MKTIQLQIEDSNFEAFMTIVKNLKNGMIKNLEVRDSDFEEAKLYFQECLEDIENGKTRLLTQDEYKSKMDSFREDLKLKYANN